MVTQIADWNDLDAAIQGTNGSNETGDFELVSNLDKDTAGYAGVGDSWEPCGFNATGSTGTGFQGTFDGQGHVIRDLIIDDSGINEQSGTDRPRIGLFGSTEGGDGTTVIENLIVDGEITGDDPDDVGMIVGYLADANVVRNCVAAGSISSPGGDSIGGFCGEAFNSIENCLSLTDVSGDSRVAGFIGFNQGAISTSIAAGSVSANSIAGGFAAEVNASSETDCFFDTDATGQSTTGGNATGLPTSDLQGDSASTNLTNFDFTNDWKEVIGGTNSDVDGYPHLRGLSVHAQSSVQTARFNPFSIVVTGTNSPVNADGELTLNVDITNNGSFEGEADLELIVEEA